MSRNHPPSQSWTNGDCHHLASPLCTRISLQAHPFLKYAGKKILDNVAHLDPVDSLQRHHRRERVVIFSLPTYNSCLKSQEKLFNYTWCYIELRIYVKIILKNRSSHEFCPLLFSVTTPPNPWLPFYFQGLFVTSSHLLCF